MRVSFSQVHIRIAGDLVLHYPHPGKVVPFLHVDEGMTVVLQCQRIFCSIKPPTASAASPTPRPDASSFTLWDATQLGLGSALLVQCAYGTPAEGHYEAQQRHEMLKAELHFGGVSFRLVDEFQSPVVQFSMGTVHGTLVEDQDVSNITFEEFGLQCGVFSPEHQQWEPLLEVRDVLRGMPCLWPRIT